MTIEAGKFKIRRADISQFESEGRKLLQNQEGWSQHEGCVRQENSLSVGKGLFRLSSAWMRSTHVREGNLLYSVP